MHLSNLGGMVIVCIRLARLSNGSTIEERLYRKMRSACFLNKRLRQKLDRNRTWPGEGSGQAPRRWLFSLVHVDRAEPLGPAVNRKRRVNH